MTDPSWGQNETSGIDWSDRQALARGHEGLFCIDNITYSDGRWERPFYTMDEKRAHGYWQWLLEGGWCPRFEQFRDGEWRPVNA